MLWWYLETTIEKRQSDTDPDVPWSSSTTIYLPHARKEKLLNPIEKQAIIVAKNGRVVHRGERQPGAAASLTQAT